MYSMKERFPGVATDILIWLSRLGFAYLFIFTIVIYFTSVCLVIPAVNTGDTPKTRLHCVASTYIFIGLLYNCYMLYKEDSFLTLNAGVKPTKDQNYRSDWKECRICNVMAPPRSHHCVLCQRCVLVREHHCFFTGFCVGQKNLKHYLVFCYYCSVGCFYSLFLMVSYASKVYFSPLSWRLLHFFFPFTLIEAVFGFQSWDFLFFVLLIYVSLTGCLGSAAAFLWHLKLALIGKTSYEYLRGLPGRDRGYLKNLKLTFGEYWLFNFLLPFQLKNNQYPTSVKVIWLVRIVK